MKKISNFSVLSSLILIIILNKLILKKDIIIFEDIIENILLTIIFFTVWSKNLIGGGDLKILLIFLIYIPSNSYFSIIPIHFFIFSDRFEFFFFLFFLFFLKGFSDEIKYLRNNNKKPSKPTVLASYFLLSSFLMILF